MSNSKQESKVIENNIGKYKIGFTVRRHAKEKNGKRIYNSKYNWKHEMYKIFKKIKRIDKSVSLGYGIHIETDKDKGFHVHGLIRFNNYDNVINNLESHFGKNAFGKNREWQNNINYDGFDGSVLWAKYGSVFICDIMNERQYVNYINAKGIYTEMW